MSDIRKEYKKVTTNSLAEMKQNGEKISMLTAYDYTLAKIIDSAGIDVILVGDSASNVMAGHETTLPITLNQMIYHASAVVRAVDRALVVVDLPFGSYEADKIKAFDVAAEIISKTNATAVKLEGGKEIEKTIDFLVSRGIPVMGHIGLMPQKINLVGKFSYMGKNKKEENKILEDARAVSEAGAFAFVLEAMKSHIGKIVSKELATLSIGIGAGKYCDGQVLVIDDLLGFYSNFSPKFVKKYTNLEQIVNKSVEQFCNDVRNSKYPTKKNSY